MNFFSGQILHGSYNVIRILKKGHGIETLVGRDSTQNRVVLIKAALAKTIPVGAQVRIKLEAARLRVVHSASLAPIIQYAKAEHHLYMIRPYIPGVSLEERLQKGRALQLREAVSVGCCLLEALAEAHQAGIFHHNLKPSEVILQEAHAEQGCVLTDFSFVRSDVQSPPFDTGPVGQAPYHLSPEQTGLIKDVVDQRADLHAMGVLLFTCLTGRPPFEAETINELLRQQLSTAPPRLRALGLPIPRMLDEILQRLLRKDPMDRYQSACAALVDLRVVAQALEQGVADTAIVVGCSDRRSSLAEPAFVGRRTELAALYAALASVRHGRPALVTLEAPSGGGKTALLDEFEQGSLAQSAWVLRGRGANHGAQRPFQILDDVARAIIDATKTDLRLREGLQQRLNSHSLNTVIYTVFPQLMVLAQSPMQTLRLEEYGETKVVKALCSLMSALGTADTPAVVLLDNYQWADDLLMKFMAHWQSWQDKQQEFAGNVLLVVAFCTEDVPNGHPLRNLHPSAHLRLPSFESEEVRALVCSMAGPLPMEAIEFITKFAEGSPFMAVAILRGLVESRALEIVGSVGQPPSAESSWRLAPQVWISVQSSRQAALFLARRIDLLPRDTLRVLTAGAVLGQEFDLELTATLLGFSTQQAVAMLEEARLRHFAWIDAEGRIGTFIHDKLRQTLLDRLQTKERQALHRRAACLIKENDPHRVYDLAHHLSASGNYQQALPFALTAAKQASSQYSLETAEHYYRMAERGLEAADASTRLTVATSLGSVLMRRGRYDEAAKKFEEARSLTDDRLMQARLEGQFGELAMKRGDVKTACYALERALRLLERPVPQTFAKSLALLLWETCVQTAHGLLPRLFVKCRPTEGAEAELLAVRLYSLLAHTYFFHRDMVSAVWSHLCALNLADHYPMTEELAQAYSDHGLLASMLPYFSRAVDFSAKSLAIRTALGCIRGQAQSLHFYGIILWTQARYAEALDKYRQAISLLQRTGDPWEMNIALYHLACCLYRMGDLRGAIETSRRLHKIGIEIGDMHASAISLEPWAKASGGRISTELIETAWHSAKEDVHIQLKLLQAKALLLLNQGHPNQAVSTLVEAHTLVRRAGQRGEYVASISSWLATALRHEADLIPAFNPRQRRVLLQHAQAMARRGLRLARLFPNNLPHALRENAVLAAIRGRTRRALRLFEESLRVAEAQGAVYEHAQTLLAKGQVGSAIGWDGAEQEVTWAQSTIHLLKADMAEQQNADTSQSASELKQDTWSSIDRLDTLMNVGHRITSADTKEAIFAEVWNAMQTLLRGEQCVVLECQRKGETPFWKTVAGGMAEEDVSRAMVSQALTSPRPIVFQPGMHEDTPDSLILSGVQSALCAPIMAHDKVIGCLCAAHYQINILFGEEEIRLAEFITKLAGAALERADGFGELQRAHKQLQARAEDVALIAEVGTLVIEPGDLQALLQKCAEILVRHLNAAFVYIWTQKDSLALLELQAHAGRYTHINGSFSHSPVPTLNIERILRDGRPYFTNTIPTDSIIQDKQWIDREALVSYAAYPLTVENRVVGVMAMFGGQALPSDTAQSISFIAESLAQCVIRKWAEEEIRALNFELEGRVALRTQQLESAKQVLEGDLLKRKRDERRLTAHYEVTRQLAESSTLEQTTVNILRTICESLDWQAGYFWRVDKHTEMIRYVDGWPYTQNRFTDFTELSSTLAFNLGEGFPGRIWALASPLWIPEIDKDDNFPRRTMAQQIGVCCAFGLPIVFRGNVLGAMEFFSPEVRAPDEDLLKMMMAIGSQIGQFIERKQAEEALQASEERFRTVAETAAEGIITMDETSTLVFVNRATEQIFGYTEAEMLGQNLSMLMPERLRSAHHQAMARYLDTHKRHLSWEAVHLQGRHKNGKEIPLELAFWEFNQHSRKYFGSIVRDITDRVQASELRKRLLERVIFAQEEERKRIARELHDETGQSLMSLLMGLQTIETAPTLIAAQEHAKKQSEFVAKALDEVKRLAMGLRPSVLDDLGLVAVLERYAGDFMRTFHIAVDIHAQGLENTRLPSAIETTLYRIIQEALTNVSKHSGATIVSIVIQRLTSSVRVIVEDNGSGFDVEATIQSLPRTKHLGLLSMNERAGLVNGSLIIESMAEGTTVCVELPLEEALHGQNQTPHS